MTKSSSNSKYVTKFFVVSNNCKNVHLSKYFFFVIVDVKKCEQTNNNNIIIYHISGLL